VLWGVAAVAALLLLLTFAVSVHTAAGLRADASAFRRASGGPPSAFRAASQRTIDTIDVATVAAALVLLLFLALVRGRVARGVGAAAVVGLSLGTTEVLKHVLPFGAGRPATFPSGHTTIAASLGVALVLAVPPLLRPTAALAGAAYAAGIAFSVVLLGWHYPSDAIGGFFVVAFWAAVVGAVLPGSTRQPALSVRGVGVAVAAVAVALFAAAVIASHHPTAVDTARSRPALVAAAAAFGILSLAVFATLTPLLGERA
jgi:membrane-associated phospholipid phosphatase